MFEIKEYEYHKPHTSAYKLHITLCVYGIVVFERFFHNINGDQNYAYTHKGARESFNNDVATVISNLFKREFDYCE